MIRRLALALALALVAFTGCINGALTPAAKSALVAGEGALCSALLPLAMPGGGTWEASACQGSETLLALALSMLPAASSPLISPASGGGGPPRPVARPALVLAGKIIGYATPELGAQLLPLLPAAAAKLAAR